MLKRRFCYFVEYHGICNGVEVAGVREVWLRHWKRAEKTILLRCKRSGIVLETRPRLVVVKPSWCQAQTGIPESPSVRMEKAANRLVSALDTGRARKRKFWQVFQWVFCTFLLGFLFRFGWGDGHKT